MLKLVLVLAVLAWWLLSDEDPRPTRAPARAPGEMPYQVGAGSPGEPVFSEPGVGRAAPPPAHAIHNLPTRVLGSFVPAPVIGSGKPGPSGGTGGFL